MVAGRYGSLGAGGISFTEMEYDYAIAQGKPAIGFVHADPGSIAASKTEISEQARAKLQKFIQKIKKRPVRQFNNPHELALEVTTSFVQLIRDRPAVGYIRTDASVDFKRYSEVLEENNRLKETLSAAQHSLATIPFPADKSIQLAIVSGYGKPVRTVVCSLGQGFKAVAEAALLYEDDYQVFSHAAKLLLGEPEMIQDDILLGFNPASVRTLRRDLLLYGLIEVGLQDRSSYNSFDKITATETVTIWRLTDYGRRQLAAIAP